MKRFVAIGATNTAATKGSYERKGNIYKRYSNLHRGWCSLRPVPLMPRVALGFDSLSVERYGILGSRFNLFRGYQSYLQISIATRARHG